MDKIKIDLELLDKIVNEYEQEELKEFSNYEGKITFRPHRGGTVYSSWAEAKEFTNMQEMKEYIVEQWDNMFSIDDIVVQGEAVYDKRIGWKDSRYVCVKKLGDIDYIQKYGCPQCIGYCATDYIKRKE